MTRVSKTRLLFVCFAMLVGVAIPVALFGGQAESIRLYDLSSEQLFGLGIYERDGAPIVATVPSGSQALRAGDVILQVGNTPVGSVAELQDLLPGGSGPGLLIQRGRDMRPVMAPGMAFERADPRAPLEITFGVFSEVPEGPGPESGMAIAGLEGLSEEERREILAQQAGIAEMEADPYVDDEPQWDAGAEDPWQVLEAMFGPGGDMETTRIGPNELEGYDEEFGEDEEVRLEEEREIESQRAGLQSSTESARVTAALQLGVYAGEIDAAAEILAKALRDPSRSVKRAAGLGLVGALSMYDELGLTIALEASSDASADVRHAAVEQLGFFGGGDAVGQVVQEALVRALLGTDDELRLAAEGVLADLEY